MTTLTRGTGQDASTSITQAALTQAALAEAAQSHRQGIWRYLRFLGCDESSADDLTQETFLAVTRADATNAVALSLRDRKAVSSNGDEAGNGLKAARRDDARQENVVRASARQDDDAGIGPQNGQPIRDLLAYLRGVARNLFLKWIERTRRERAVQDIDVIDVEMAEEVYRQFAGDDDGEAWLTALRGCVERLEGRSQQAINLHYRDGQSREAIAGALDMKPDGVKTLLRRTRDVLRQCVERKMRAE